MNKIITLSLATTLSLCASQLELGTIDVEAKAGIQLIRDVSEEEIKSADLGEALFKHSSSVSLVRRSGIANDIRVRG
jgi:iron complex outermembrane receptor protein